VPLCPLQISSGLTCSRTRSSAVRGRRRTMVRHGTKINLCYRGIENQFVSERTAMCLVWEAHTRESYKNGTSQQGFGNMDGNGCFVCQCSSSLRKNQDFLPHDPRKKLRLLHTDASKPSFKALLLNNGNVERSHLPIHPRKNHVIVCPSC